MSDEKDHTIDGIYIIGNHVYFYAMITDITIAAFAKEFHNCENQMLWQQTIFGLPEPPGIVLHVHCYGGDLMAAFLAADRLAHARVPVTSIVEGVAASGGTIISMACHHRQITKHSTMMIHQLSNVVWGTHEQVKDRLEWQKKLMRQLIDFYADHSKMTRKTIRAALKHDTSFTPDDAVSAGLVDEIL